VIYLLNPESGVLCLLEDPEKGTIVERVVEVTYHIGFYQILRSTTQGLVLIGTYLLELFYKIILVIDCVKKGPIMDYQKS
jgi:hypothetical protein